MHSIHHIFEYIRHIDETFHPHGPNAYLVLFLVMFAGIVTPFLPGETLLFLVGVLARPEKQALNIWILLPLMTVAPLFGDTTNFMLGRWFGHHIFSDKHKRFLRRSALAKTHEFFEKYGRNTIILARWIAIVRSIAPFVAGMSQMEFRHFIRYSAIGAFFWVWGCLLAGYFFGAIPAVKENFAWAILAMLFVGVIPISFEILKQRQEIRERERSADRGKV